MDYSGTLRRGWDIVWQNKWLWLLALLPSVLSVLNVAMTSFADNGLVDPTSMSAGRGLLLSCLSLLVSLAVLAVGLITRGGMIDGVARLARGEATGFSRSFHEGWRKLPRLLGMSILLYALPIILFFAAVMLVLVPVTIGTMAGGSGQNELLAGMGVLGTVLICCVSVGFLVVMLLLGLIYPFAFRGITLRDMGAVESIRHGWRVLRENAGEIILLALPFLIVYLIFGVISTALYFLIVAPDGIENAVLSGTMMTNNWRFLLVFFIYGLFGAVLTAWQSATFTLGYLQWTGKDVLTDPYPSTPSAPLM